MSIRIWTIGPSGGGKTTLIKGLVSRLGRKAYLIDADVVGYNTGGDNPQWRIPKDVVTMGVNVSNFLPCMLAGIATNFESKLVPKLIQTKYLFFACPVLSRTELLRRNGERVKRKEREKNYITEDTVDDHLAWYNSMLARIFHKGGKIMSWGQEPIETGAALLGFGNPGDITYQSYLASYSKGAILSDLGVK